MQFFLILDLNYQTLMSISSSTGYSEDTLSSQLQSVVWILKKDLFLQRSTYLCKICLKSYECPIYFFVAPYCQEYCKWAQNVIALPKPSTNADDFVFFLPEIMAAKLEATLGNIFSQKEKKGAATNPFL